MELDLCRFSDALNDVVSLQTPYSSIPKEAWGGHLACKPDSLILRVKISYIGITDCKIKAKGIKSIIQERSCIVY